MNEEYEVDDMINTRKNAYIAESVRILQNSRAFNNKKNNKSHKTLQLKVNNTTMNMMGIKKVNQIKQDTLQLLVSLVQSFS